MVGVFYYTKYNYDLGENLDRPYQTTDVGYIMLISGIVFLLMWVTIAIIQKNISLLEQP